MKFSINFFKNFRDICPVPVNSRAPPPEINYEEARIQLAIINEEVCSFIPRINPTVSCDIEVEDRRSDISERLKKAARKLRKYSIVPEGIQKMFKLIV